MRWVINQCTNIMLDFWSKMRMCLNLITFERNDNIRTRWKKEKKKKVKIWNKGGGNWWWKQGRIKGKANNAMDVDSDLFWSHQVNCTIGKKICAAAWAPELCPRWFVLSSLVFLSCYKNSMCFLWKRCKSSSGENHWTDSVDSLILEESCFCTLIND